MIEIQLSPTRVERVCFTAGSSIEEDFDLAAWQAIRPLVDKIDRRLKKITRGFVTPPATGDRIRHGS
jgi:hypothetical protein